MTKREPGQDFDPKHRIVGAIVIVALAVILIPLILSERESSNGEPDAAPVVAEEPSGDGNKVAVTTLSPPTPAAESVVNTPAPSPEEKTSSTKVDAKPKAPEAKPAPPRQAETKTPSSGWVVQVGTFSNTANASRLEKKLRAQRQPVLTERVTVAGSAAVRLRVGPFGDGAAALKARERINKDVGVKGVVLAYP